MKNANFNFIQVVYLWYSYCAFVIDLRAPSFPVYRKGMLTKRYYLGKSFNVVNVNSPTHPIDLRLGREFAEKWTFNLL